MKTLTLKGGPREPRNPAIAAALEKLRAERATPKPAPSDPQRPKATPPPKTGNRDPEVEHRAAKWLRASYPDLFGGEAKPLALGAGAAIAKARPEGVSHKGIQRAIRRWTNRQAYRRALAAEGSRRFNLDGSDAGLVSDEHRELAQQRVKKPA